MLKCLFGFILSLVIGHSALAYNVGTSYPDTRPSNSSVILEGYYDQEYTCKKVPQIRTECGFRRDCFNTIGHRCREIPYCAKIGTFVQQCGNEDVFKLRPETKKRH